MKIRIEGVGGVNKGAELMLVAAIDEIYRRIENPTIVYCDFNKKSPLRRIISYFVFKYILRKNSKAPFDEIRSVKRLLKTLPLTSYNSKMEVDLILDAGGFQFSDQFDNDMRNSKSQITRLNRAKEQGTKIVFLPQAFGPFRSKISLDIIHKIYECSDLIMAREEVSANHLKNALDNISKIKVFPDFTNLVEGKIDNDLQMDLNGKICLIPNMKMISHTEEGDGKRYVDFFVVLMKMLYRSKEPFYLLNHEGSADLKLCNLFRQKSKIRNIPIINIQDSKKVKAVIGSAKLVISSRYHGVASALSQGIPVYATSWSHKYDLLYNDYGIENGVIDYSDKDASLEIIETALSEESLTKYQKKLVDVIPSLKRQSRLMWDEVFSLI